MEELIDYVKWKKLSDETKEKLISYYETKYRGKYFEEDTLLADMNDSLREEISCHNTRKLIEKVPFSGERQETGETKYSLVKWQQFFMLVITLPGILSPNKGIREMICFLYFLEK
ncbi:hypothetical protein BDR26DRAFT_897680 [Obelidium mucronatum]|nr:hypothetical protein BDR26DRAFT_897680 [Obelidium mucronatum]